MDPYEANPDKILPDDRYADVPFYGRYYPRPVDFRPNPKYLGSGSDASLKYWESVLVLCSESTRIYEDTEGGRDVFALGSVIVKSSHLHVGVQGRRLTRDYSYADENEVKATELARGLLGDVMVPAIYFAGKVNGLDVLVQERIPGVGLNIAWQYISRAQKQDFKQQAREILFQLHDAKPSSCARGQPVRSYIVVDPDPVSHRGIQELERDIIFSEENRDPDLGFMHNDFSLSNCIVDNDRIVGLVDWEMAGFWGGRRRRRCMSGYEPQRGRTSPPCISQRSVWRISSSGTTCTKLDSMPVLIWQQRRISKVR